MHVLTMCKKGLILTILTCVGYGWRLIPMRRVSVHSTLKVPSTSAPKATLAAMLLRPSGQVRAEWNGRRAPFPFMLELGTSMPRETTAMMLRMLCQVARVEKGMAAVTTWRKGLVQPTGFRAADMQQMSSILNDFNELLAPISTLQAMSKNMSTMMGSMPNSISTMGALKQELANLHIEAVRQEDEIKALEEEARFASNTTRAREIFELLDTNQDGALDLDEFIQRAKILQAIPLPPEILSEIFAKGDADQDGRLDFEEFEVMLTTMSREKLGPYRQGYAYSLAQLLLYDLELISRTIAVELDRTTKEAGAAADAC